MKYSDKTSRKTERKHSASSKSEQAPLDSMEQGDIASQSGNLDPQHILQMQRTLGNQYVVNNMAPKIDRKAKSNMPVVKMANSTAQQPVIQTKAVDKEGKVLSIEQLIKEFKKPEYEAGEYDRKLKEALAQKKVHKHNTKNPEKAKANRDEIVQEMYKTNKAPGSENLPDKLKGANEALARAKSPAKEVVYSDLKRAIDKKNPMFFTIEDIKKYLDGTPVPGISDLGQDDIKGGNDEVLPLKAGTQEQWSKRDFENLDEAQAEERAKTIVETMKRMKENRTHYAEQTAEIVDGQVPEDADDEIKLLAKTFKNTTFFYGTTGELASNKTKFGNLFAKVKKIKAERLGDKAGSYSAGIRNMGFMKAMAGGENAQMMDMYYGGQDFETWHMMANPIIAKHVHKMMGYAGEYNHAESMDTTFRKNFPLGGDSNNWENRGWSQNSKPNFEAQRDKMENEKPVLGEDNKPVKENFTRPENGALKQFAADVGWDGKMSGTMEISRIIREGVQKYGGTIVFEGSEVTNQSHFVPEKYGDMRDTNVEASQLLPEFAKSPGSSEVPYGAGKLVFHWMGKPTAPSRDLFLKHWAYATPAEENITRHEVIYFEKKNIKPVPLSQGDPGRDVQQLRLDIPVDWYWNFPRSQARVALDNWKKMNLDESNEMEYDNLPLHDREAQAEDEQENS